MFPFRELTALDQLEEVDRLSREGNGVLIYKHSTRCFISALALKRLKEWEPDETPVFYLDLLRYRDISDSVAKRYGVLHESPQLLWVVNGTCVEHTSHNGVSSEVIETWLTHA